jgi:CubicO group peptidase (beta-lactamase class C family)
MDHNQIAITDEPLSDFVKAAAQKYGIPGAAVGVWTDGRERYACHGVTSIENPLPIDPNTLFLIGSVTKTYTATALMCLVAKGLVELKAPVRHYVPELKLANEQAAKEITVLNLLNHTAGLDNGLIVDTGEGDEALSTYVAKMAELNLVAAPGVRASYSQAGYNLAGRIIEKITGLTYERAVATLVLEPLGLSHSFFNRDDILTRRFAVGHNPDAGGTLSIARLWRRWRGDNPGGGLASSASDQIRWARFHLGEGCAQSGIRVLPAEPLIQMKQPTIPLRGSTLGDAIGLSWFLRDVEGVRTVGHGGSANGQFAELLTVPERAFAVVALSNASPGGIPFNQAVVHWALETYLGVVEREPVALPYDEQRALEIIGKYETSAQALAIRKNEAGLTLEVGIKPEIRAAADKPLPPDYPPEHIGLLPGDKDEYIVTSGGLKGQRGFCTRDENGVIVGVDLAGRLFKRSSAVSE